VPDPEVYPPARHVLRDLELTTEIGPGLLATGWLPVSDETRADGGVIHTGVLATAVDVLGGGLAAVAAQPDWIATADLTLHVIPRAVDAVMLRGHVARRGRTTAVLAVELAGDSEPLGLATMTFAILPRRDSNPTVTSGDTVSRMTLALADSGFRAPFEMSTGIRVDADGAELPVSDYVRNSLGAVQGGLMAATAVAAAHAGFAAHFGATAIVDLQVTYLALAKVGPVRAGAEIVDAQDSFATARVELTDPGADGRTTTLVSARGVRL
jgi:acyl-coenzyme A thioesterase PaaI-like protein